MENNSNYFTRNIIKKSIFIILIFLLVCSIANVSNASADLGDLEKYGGNPDGSTRVNEIAGMIVGIIRIIGTVLSIAILVVIGIKYMMGSVEERADYKETLKPYLIGVFLLFTGTLVPQLIYTLSQNLK